MLQDIPIRHLFHRVHSKQDDITNQLMMLTKVDVYNYLILGASDTIDKVLMAGSKARMNTNKFAWYAMTKENSPEIKCDSCTDDMPILYTYPMVKKYGDHRSNLKVADIRRDFGIDIGADVDISFYFTAALSSLKAIR